MNALLFSPQDNLTLRVLRLFVGMFLAAFGISTITTAGLGTTPISTYLLYWLFFLVIPLGKQHFSSMLFLSLVNLCCWGENCPGGTSFNWSAVFVFSAFIDLSMFLIAALKPEAWGGQLLMSLAGNLFLALGIVLQISSKTLVQPGEGIVLAIAVRLQRSFGDYQSSQRYRSLCAWLPYWVLVVPDLFIGLREGTLISALLVGISRQKDPGY